jgi:hypothetical protein
MFGETVISYFYYGDSKVIKQLHTSWGHLSLLLWAGWNCYPGKRAVMNPKA